MSNPAWARMLVLEAKRREDEETARLEARGKTDAQEQPKRRRKRRRGRKKSHLRDSGTPAAERPVAVTRPDISVAATAARPPRFVCVMIVRMSSFALCDNN